MLIAVMVSGISSYIFQNSARITGTYMESAQSHSLIQRGLEKGVWLVYSGYVPQDGATYPYPLGGTNVQISVQYDWFQQRFIITSTFPGANYTMRAEIDNAMGTIVYWGRHP